MQSACPAFSHFGDTAFRVHFFESSFVEPFACNSASAPHFAGCNASSQVSAFHCANFLVHILPCAHVVSWEIATPLSLAHGALAAAIHVGWGVWRSNWTMVLDDIYVPLPRAKWLVLWSVAVATNLVVPTLLGMWHIGQRPLEQNAAVAELVELDEEAARINAQLRLALEKIEEARRM